MLLTLVGGLTSELFSLEASLLILGLTIGALSFVLEPSPKTARRMFYGSLLYLPSWLNFCYIGCLMKRRTIWLRKVSLTEFCMGLICRTKNRNGKTGNLLVYNQALQLPMLPWLHFLSYRCPYILSHENLLWFFLQQWACGTVGLMCSCFFGLLYMIFLPSRGVLGACVLEVIGFFFFFLFYLRIEVINLSNVHTFKFHVKWWSSY
jgi:hypothetical protein